MNCPHLFAHTEARTLYYYGQPYDERVCLYCGCYTWMGEWSTESLPIEQWLGLLPERQKIVH